MYTRERESGEERLLTFASVGSSALFDLSIKVGKLGGDVRQDISRLLGLSGLVVDVTFPVCVMSKSGCQHALNGGDPQ